MLSFVVAATLILNTLAQHKCESFDRELALYMIPSDQLTDYKETYHRVYDAIYSIEPEYRQIYKSHEVLTTPLDTIDDVVDRMMESVAIKLKIDTLDEELIRKFKDRVAYSKMGVTSSMEKYVKINMSFKWGGKAHIMVGAVGYKKLTKDKIVFGASLYKEEWKEKEWVRLVCDKNRKEKDCVWDDGVVEKFAFYALYQNLIVTGQS